MIEAIMGMPIFINKATLNLSKILLYCGGYDKLISNWTRNDVFFSYKYTADSLMPLIYTCHV